VKICIDLY